MADTYTMLAAWRYRAPSIFYPLSQGQLDQAEALLELATHGGDGSTRRLGGELAELYLGRAFINQAYSRRFHRAAYLFDKARIENGSYAPTYQWLAGHLAKTGQFEEALESISTAYKLDPTTPIISADRAWISYLAGEYEQAIKQCEQLRQKPDQENFVPALYYQALALTELDRYEEAIGLLQTANHLSPGGRFLGALGYVYGRTGDAENLRAVRAQAFKIAQSQDGYVSRFDVARMSIGEGDFDSAITFLRAAVTDADSGLDILGSHPQFAKLEEARNEEFHDILFQLGVEWTVSATPTGGDE